MGSDPPPDDVRLTSKNLGAVCERRSAIGRPSYLPHPRLALDALDAQLRCKRLVCQAGDETSARRGMPGAAEVRVAASHVGTGAALRASAPSVRLSWRHALEMRVEIFGAAIDSACTPGEQSYGWWRRPTTSSSSTTTESPTPPEKRRGSRSPREDRITPRAENGIPAFPHFPTAWWQPSSATPCKRSSAAFEFKRRVVRPAHHPGFTVGRWPAARQLSTCQPRVQRRIGAGTGC